MVRTFILKSRGNASLEFEGEDTIFKEEQPTDVGNDITWCANFSFDGVQNLSSSKYCSCDAIVSWDRATCAQWPPITYNLYYDTVTPPFNGTKIEIGYYSSTPYKICDLNASQLYYFGVRGVNSSAIPYEDSNMTILSRRMPYQCQTIGSKWSKQADYLNENAIYSFLVFNNKLYAGTGNFMWGTGYLNEWDEVDSWIQRTSYFSDLNGILGMVEFNGKLYGTGNKRLLLEWNGTDAWNLRAGPTGEDTDPIYSPYIFNSQLYAVGNDQLYKWDGSSNWINIATTPYWANQLESLIEFDGKLYCAGGSGYPTYWPATHLFEWDGGTNLIVVAPAYLPDYQYANPWGDRISKLLVLNNKIYGTTWYGRLLEWNGTDAWTLVAERMASGVTFRRECGISYCDGIYCATRDGKLLEWKGDRWESVAASSGWTQLAALIYFKKHMYAASMVAGILLRWEC